MIILRGECESSRKSRPRLYCRQPSIGSGKLNTLVNEIKESKQTVSYHKT